MGVLFQQSMLKLFTAFVPP